MLDRILIIVPGFPASEDDTTCLPAVQNYVRALGRHHPHIDVDVAALQYPFRTGHYTWHGISVFAAGGSNRGGLDKLRTWRRAWMNVRRADLVHSFWIGECTLLGALAARRFSCGHVASIGGRELLQPTLYSRLLRRASFLLVAGSQQAADTADLTLRRRADAVIPLGLDVERFATRAYERTIDVLAVGSLIETKRFVEVLQVARALPEARFVLVGDGPQRSELEASAPSNVQFAGHVDRPQVIRLMRQSKVLLHPSAFESQGYVFLEGLASGMHVVCRDVGAPGASANVHRRKTVGEMTETISEILSSIHSFPPVPVPSAEDSVRAYVGVYRQAVAGGWVPD